MNMLTRSLSLLLLVSSIGCGSDSPGSVTGSVHGATIGISDAVSSAVTIDTANGQVHGAAIVMATTSGLCGDASGNIEHPNQKGLTIVLFDINGTTFTTPTAPGAYTIYQSGSPPPKAATLSVFAVDATCAGIDSAQAAGATGTVNLTGVSGNAFDGNFDVALDSGDHITGSFSPGECPAIQTVLNSTSAPICQ